MKKLTPRQAPKHADMTHFADNKNELVIGGKKISQKKKIVGWTPFFSFF